MARKKWEYLQVNIAQGSDGSMAVTGWPVTSRMKITTDVLDDIGSYNWELVSVSGTNYIFKRELDN